MSTKNVITLKDQISTEVVYESSDSLPGWKKPITSGAAKAGVPI